MFKKTATKTKTATPNGRKPREDGVFYINLIFSEEKIGMRPQITPIHRQNHDILFSLSLEL